MSLKLALGALHREVALLMPRGVGVEAIGGSSVGNYGTLVAAFSEAAGNVKGDVKLAKAIIGYTKGLATKNDDHISFFGGNRLGVDRIKFLDSDRNRWFDDVLEVDESFLDECIASVPYVQSHWNVGADSYNLSVIWAVHRLMTGGMVNDKTVREGMIEALVALQFKFFTSIWFNFFRRPVDVDAAEATYAALTLKFILKREGSWGQLMRKRAEDSISAESVRYKSFKLFADDEAVVRIVTDLHTRSKQTIIDMYGVLDRIRSGNLRIQSTESHAISVTGDKIIKDQVSAYNSARFYLLDVSGNEASFIKADLVAVILELMTTVSEAAFINLLKVIANAQEGAMRKEVEWMMENTLMHAFDYIATNRINFRDVSNILVKMRFMYMSSKSTEPLLLELRTRIERFVKKNSHLSAQSALASARTSLMLYFLLRALYSGTYK